MILSQEMNWLWEDVWCAQGLEHRQPLRTGARVSLL